MMRINKGLLILIIVGLLASLWVAVGRVKVERANRTVDIVIDGNDLRDLGAAWGAPLAQALQRFRKAGASSIAVGEDTFGAMSQSGKILVAATTTDEQSTRIAFTLWPADTSAYQQIYANLKAKCPPSIRILPYPAAGAIKLYWPGSMEELDRIGLGLPADQIKAVKTAGLTPVARLRNFSGITPKAINFMLKEARKTGATTLICDQEEVVGYQGFLQEAATLLRLYGISYGSVEFTKQRGDVGLSRALKGNLVRVHSITENEILNMSPPQAVDRFVRGVRDRNIRVCYLRLFRQPRQNAFQYNLDYVSHLTAALKSAGFRLGSAQPFAPFSTPTWLLAIIWLGVAAAGVLLLANLFPLNARLQWWIFAIACVLGALILMGAPGLGRKLFALKAASIFPVLGLVAARGLLHWDQRGQATESSGLLAIIWRAVIFLAAASAISVVGGLFIGGLLGDRIFLVKVDQFAGIKLSYLFPIFMLAAIFIGEVFARESEWAAWQDRVKQRFSQFLNHPLLVWQCILLALVLAAGAIFVLRTGNLAEGAVSSLELKARSALESILISRPRTKELLIGHPALILMAALALLRRKRWTIPLLLIGAIGQVSIINTYCHIHSNLLISLLRTFNGLWLGAIIGIVLVLIWHWAGWLRQQDSHCAGTEPTSPK